MIASGIGGQEADASTPENGENAQNEISESQPDSEDAAESEAPEAPADPDIVGTVWEWVRFDDTAGFNNIVVDDPSLYTFTLNADGTYQIKADCNFASGGYTLEGSSLTLQSGPTTLAECGSESLYNIYLTQLGNVGTFVIDGDSLVLNLWADGGNMVFAPAE